ncbi:hypothetical protein SAY86_007247 [Trapa natans]|uniref:Uncharacterized protein n=1 Tax=Trapa natans TaxID=22666 RepID=A0AAN7LH05_TRANT|nr:hypothetical protein SAY86_007247 [Trapa natans]
MADMRAEEGAPQEERMEGTGNRAMEAFWSEIFHWIAGDLQEIEVTMDALGPVHYLVRRLLVPPQDPGRDLLVPPQDPGRDLLVPPQDPGLDNTLGKALPSFLASVYIIIFNLYALGHTLLPQGGTRTTLFHLAKGSAKSSLHPLGAQLVIMGMYSSGKYKAFRITRKFELPNFPVQGSAYTDTSEEEEGNGCWDIGGFAFECKGSRQHRFPQYGSSLL